MVFLLLVVFFLFCWVIECFELSYYYKNLNNKEIFKGSFLEYVLVGMKEVNIKFFILNRL